jgi:RNA-directed DNA polymerase
MARVIRWRMRLHRWKRKLVRPTADGIDLFSIAKVPVTRYQSRGSKIPGPWTLPNHAQPHTPCGARRQGPARRIR